MNNIGSELIKNPVLEIQMYLNNISKCKPEIPVVNPSGVYDDKTKQAVTIFQNTHGIPSTGKVDITTWNALVNENKLCDNKNKAITPNKVSIFPSADHICKLGDECDVVYVIQILLRSFGKKYKYDKINITGKYDSDTENAIKRFQEMNKLDVTGNVDLETWNALTQINNVCGFYSI